MAAEALVAIKGGTPLLSREPDSQGSAFAAYKASPRPEDGTYHTPWTEGCVSVSGKLSLEEKMTDIKGLPRECFERWRFEMWKSWLPELAGKIGVQIPKERNQQFDKDTITVLPLINSQRTHRLKQRNVHGGRTGTVSALLAIGFNLNKAWGIAPPRPTASCGDFSTGLP